MRSKWQNIILSELGTIQTGKTPAGNIKDAYGIGIPFITPKDMDGRKYIRHTERYLTVAGINSIKNYVIPKNSVSVSCIGSDMGKVIMTDKDSVTNQQINSIIVNIDKHEPEYIYYNLSSRRQELKKMAGGTTMPIINKTDFSKINIQLPPLPTQKKIAHILSTLDDKIELNRKMNQTLEAMAQALFKSWFVDFDPVHVKLTCKSEEALKIAAKKLGISKEILDLFPNEFEESELGMIPKGWEVKTLSSICKLITKGTTPNKLDLESASDDATIPFIKVKDITNTGEINRNNLENIPNSVHLGSIKRSILEKNDLLFSIAGTIGRVAVVDSDLANANTNQALGIIRLKDKEEYLHFVWLALKSDGIQNNILSKVVQGVQANTSLTNLRDIQIIYPASNILSKWNNLAGNLIEKFRNNQTEIRTLQKTRDTLLPKLLSGELDVLELNLDEEPKHIFDIYEEKFGESFDIYGMYWNDMDKQIELALECIEKNKVIWEILSQEELDLIEEVKKGNVLF